MDSPELLLDAKAQLGEGPSWEAGTGTLYWVNIYAGEVHAYSPGTNTDRFISLGEAVGCLAPAKAGGLVLGRRSGFARLDPKTGQATPLADPEPHLPGNRFNDGKCDPAGRFLAGTMDNAEVQASGSLYSLLPGGTVKTLLRGLRISNGLAWSPDHHTLYHIDTPTRRVMAYAYDLETGELSHPWGSIEVPEELGWPDGMTSDSQGTLWIAMWGGAKITRWDPLTGRLLEAVPVPALNVTSCAFGGEGLRDLFLTSARKGMSEEGLARFPLTGGLFRLRTETTGMPTFAFGD